MTILYGRLLTFILQGRVSYKSVNYCKT